MQDKLIKAVRKRAATPHYVSPNQLTLVEFDTPFDQKLYKGNRWVRMAQSIPTFLLLLNKSLSVISTLFKPVVGLISSKFL